eukprot:1194759-Prorocentrum_minimum.AAC.4
MQEALKIRNQFVPATMAYQRWSGVLSDFRYTRLPKRTSSPSKPSIGSTHPLYEVPPAHCRVPLRVTTWPARRCHGPPRGGHANSCSRRLGREKRKSH